MIPKSFQHPSPAKVMGQVLGRDSMEPSHPFFQPRMVSVRVLDVVDPPANTLISLRRFTARWANPISRAARAKGPFPPPSEQRTASGARSGFRTTSIAWWSSFGRIASEVAPERSRTVRAGTCSKESPRFDARPPRFRGCLGRCRCPLNERRK